MDHLGLRSHRNNELFLVLLLLPLAFNIVCLEVVTLIADTFSDKVKATQLTSTIVATAGLSIQVPISVVVDSLTGHTPRLLEYLGVASIMVGFMGINIPPDASSHAQESALQHEAENVGLPTELELDRTIFP